MMPDPREIHLQNLHNSHFGLLSIHSAFQTIYTRLIPTEEKQKTCEQKVSNLLRWAEIKGGTTGDSANTVDETRRTFQHTPEQEELHHTEAEADYDHGERISPKKHEQKNRQPEPQKRKAPKRKRAATLSTKTRRKESRAKRAKRQHTPEPPKLKPGETELLVFRPGISCYPARGPLMLDDFILACSIARAKGMHERPSRKDNGLGFLERNVLAGKQWLRAYEKDR
ncbi:hypothetical protein BJ508DRAFT_364498 [Ascobolus immersus RN42]|uniref:Uncharacterized protein n=1 Tax=Ascobolus immersus RN42 TaxID=1160509 RepID=A0A3N4HU66_ASCIM|nr:hypothetical protein BJ508DRAFT_364498 [Ascobolus immersus RN42]